MTESEKHPFTAMPIYYVIAEQIQRPIPNVPVWKILRVIETNMSNVDRLYREHVAPIAYEGRNVQAFCFYREPGNPFREAGNIG